MVLRKTTHKQHNSASSSTRTTKMKARNSSSTGDRTQLANDTDDWTDFDWTLVTPPQSNSVSPERKASPVPEQDSQDSDQDKPEPQKEQTPKQAELNTQPNDDVDPTNKLEEAAEKHSSKSTRANSDGKIASLFRDERWMELTLAATFILSLVYCVFCLGFMLGASEAGPNRNRESLKRILNRKDGAANFIYLDPSDHAYSKLKLLDEELLECIQRQNPRHEIDYNPDLTDSTPRSKPIMGLVCYEKEPEWRKKLHKLKFEHNFDIWKTLKRVRNLLTNEMLEIYHPGLRFMLITNQLDWLNRLDSERRDRELERLKAEVHELRRTQINPTKSQNLSSDKIRIAQPSRRENIAGQQAEKIQSTNNALVSLQGENTRLRIENEMLKQSLGEKAGTVYIKQSIELEKSERENSALRRFHLQVAHEVSKGLKEIDLQITDFGAILNEQEESLSARLNQTHGYLMRLVEETSQLAARNKSFEAELNEARLLNALVVHEAQNLIEGDEKTSSNNRGEQELVITNATEQQLNGADEVSLSKLTADQLRELDNFQCSGTGDCLATKVNWLMKRAKLREKLRRVQAKSSDIGTEERQQPASNTGSQKSGRTRMCAYKRPRGIRIKPSCKFLD